MSGPMVFGDPYASSSAVVGRVVAVLRGVTETRGLALAGHRSRAVTMGAVHELMITDEDARQEGKVDRVALLAFVEILEAGVILLDADVTIGDASVGVIAGFDETHMPNHQNICLRGELADGESRSIAVGDRVVISGVG
ncbi:MAG: hypothetical protein M9890_02005 [Thermomicrobiales bacterium]|nr:hypothetical protein [Thermomicrobiales bacterium]